jgi:hypothetical protein
MKTTSIDSLRRTSLWIALITCAALGFGTGAVAADPGSVRIADPAETAGAGVALPDKGESAEAAFQKLDVGGKGYVTTEDVAHLPGFAHAFQAADVKHSGRLSLNEFRKAWSMYTTHQGTQG